MTVADPAISQAPTRGAQLWRLRAAIYCQMAALGILFPFVGVWMKANSLGEGTIGVLTSITTLLGFVTGLFWAHVADRTQKPHRIAIAGYLCLSAATFYLGHCSTLIQFAIHAVAAGLVMSMALNMIPLMAVSLLESAKAGKGYASYRVFGSMGFITGTLVAPSLITEVQHLIFVASAVLLLGTVPLVRFGTETTEHQEFAPLRQVLRNRPLMGLFIALVFFAFASPAVFGFVPLYADQLHASTTFIGVLSSANGIVALVALPVAGLVIDRFGTRVMIWLALIAQPVRLLGYSLVTEDYHWLIIPQFAHFFTWAGLEIAGILFVTRNVKPGNKATALSMFLGSQIIGRFFGGIACGYLAEHMGYPRMFQITAAVVCLAILIFAISERLNRRAGTPEDDTPGPVAASPVTDRAP